MAKRRETRMSRVKQDPNLPKGFTPRTSEFAPTWEPEVGDVLQGEIVDYKSDVKVNTKRGKSDALIVHDSANDEDVTVWISAGLQGRFTKADIGSEVFIRRIKDTAPREHGQSPMKTYDTGIRS